MVLLFLVFVRYEAVILNRFVHCEATIISEEVRVVQINWLNPVSIVTFHFQFDLWL